MDFSTYGDDLISFAMTINDNSLALGLAAMAMLTGGIALLFVGAHRHETSAVQGEGLAITGLAGLAGMMVTMVFPVTSASILPSGSAENILQEQASVTYGIELSDDQASALLDEGDRRHPTSWSELIEGREEEPAQYSSVNVTLPDGDPAEAQLVWDGEEWKLEFYALERTPIEVVVSED